MRSLSGEGTYFPKTKPALIWQAVDGLSPALLEGRPVKSPSLGSMTWIKSTEPVLTVNGKNEVQLPLSSGERFFRLMATDGAEWGVRFSWPGRWLKDKANVRELALGDARALGAC
jgi:hypothetical protein